MNLAVILSGKGRDTVTAPPDANLRTIAQTLSEKGIGAILVSDDTVTLLGIISERDVVRAMARRGAEALNESVSAHMTTRVVTATRDMSVVEAMEAMTAGRFRHLPVLQAQRIEGVVSIGDLVKHRLSEMEHENRSLHDYITAV